MKIVKVKTSEQIEEIRQLFLEYEEYLCVDLCFQSFEEELSKLPGDYAPPEGKLLLAVEGKQVVGCVALRKIGEGICEMKRLFVREKYRGKGIGRKLALEIIFDAKNTGYSLMRLDTLSKLNEAISLYNSLGFKKTDPYYNNPLPGVVYWELNLKASKFI